MRIDTSRPLPFVHSARKWPRTPTFARPKPVTGQLRQLTLVAVLLIVGVFVYFRPRSGPPACTQTGIGSRSYCPATPNVERWRPVGCGSSRSVGSIQGARVPCAVDTAPALTTFLLDAAQAGSTYRPSWAKTPALSAARPSPTRPTLAACTSRATARCVAQTPAFPQASTTLTISPSHCDSTERARVEQQRRVQERRLRAVLPSADGRQPGEVTSNKARAPPAVRVGRPRHLSAGGALGEVL